MDLSGWRLYHADRIIILVVLIFFDYTECECLEPTYSTLGLNLMNNAGVLLGSTNSTAAP